MSVSTIAHRYASSLLSLALEANKLEDTWRDVQRVKDIISQSSDLADIIQSPIIEPSKKSSIMSRVLSGQVADLMSRFVDLTITKNRIGLLPDILRSFETLYYERKGVSEVIVTSVVPLTEEIKERMTSMLREKLQLRDGVQITEVHDASILGGMIIETDGRLMDLSVRNRLNSIRNKFQNN